MMCVYVYVLVYNVTKSVSERIKKKRGKGKYFDKIMPLARSFKKVEDINNSPPELICNRFLSFRAISHIIFFFTLSAANNQQFYGIVNSKLKNEQQKNERNI